jgi:hypothetical protein
MRIGLPLVLVVTLAAGAVVGAHWPRGPLPSDVRRLLDQRYPGWRFATIDAALKAQLPDDASAEWTGGDFDGDRQADYAVNIVRAGGGDTPQVVLALLRRGARYDIHTLKSIPVQQNTYVRTLPKGQVVTDVEAGSKVTAATDVVEVLYGQEAGEAFIHHKGRFRRIVSGD